MTWLLVVLAVLMAAVFFLMVWVFKREARLELAISEMTDGLLVTNSRGKIVFCNDRAVQLSGMRKKKLLGHNWLKLLRDDDPMLPLVDKIALMDRHAAFDTKMLCGDGRVLDVNVAVTPIHTWGKKTRGIVVLLRDISQRLRMEQRLERMDRMAVMGQIMAGVAHEIRNPLMGIGTSAEFLAEHSRERENSTRDIENIRREANRLEGLLKRMLSFARSEPPHRESVEVSALFEAALSMTRAQAAKKNIEIRTEVPDGLPPVFADRDQVHQVLLNVIINAIQAITGKHGTIVLSARLLSGSEAGQVAEVSVPALKVAGAEYCRLEISDDGPGMEADVLEHIFDPFFTTKPEGTGLGMAVCGRIMKSHGGMIDVISTCGQGTTVSLDLPVGGEKEKSR